MKDNQPKQEPEKKAESQLTIPEKGITVLDCLNKVAEDHMYINWDECLAYHTEEFKMTLSLKMSLNDLISRAMQMFAAQFLYSSPLSSQVKGEQTGHAIFEQVDNPVDTAGTYFAEIAKEFQGKPWIEVQHFNNSDANLQVLKVDNRTKAFCFETRTELNHVDKIYGRVQSTPTVEVKEMSLQDASINHGRHFLKSRKDEECGNMKAKTVRLLAQESFIAGANWQKQQTSGEWVPNDPNIKADVILVDKGEPLIIKIWDGKSRLPEPSHYMIINAPKP